MKMFPRVSPCPFCSFSDTAEFGRLALNKNFYHPASILKKCSNCNLFWVSPLPNEEDLSKIYAGVYHYNPSKIKDIFVALYSRLVLSSDYKLITRFKSEGKVIDIGAGRGDFLIKFTKERWKRWAHDPFLSEEEGSHLRKKIGGQVNNYRDLRKYPSGLFDVVVLRNVIEHTRNFDRLIKSIFRILKKKGILFIRTPNINSLDFRRFATKWYVVRMPGHVVFFNKKSINFYLKKHNLKPKYLKPIRFSAPLSYLRSSNSRLPLLVKLGISLLYSISSPLLGEGGDLRAIAEK